MRSRFAACAIALTFVLVACGTTDKEGDGTTTTTRPATSSTSETTGSTTTTEEGGDDDAQARAEAIDISADELPDGWTSAPHEPDDENLVTACSDYDVDELATASHYTEDFTFGDLDANDGQQFTVGTRVFEDEDTATEIMDVLPTDEFIACVNENVKTSLGGQIDGDIEAHEVETSADQTEGFSGQLTLTSTSTGETLDIWVAFVAIRTGDLITGLSGTAIGQDIDGQLVSDLADRIVELQDA